MQTQLLEVNHNLLKMS